MPQSLVESIRKCSREDRKQIALYLAGIKDHDSIEELKKMAEARHRHGLSWYDYSDQLLGIEMLGITKSLNALAFLSRLYASYRDRIEGESVCTSPMLGSGDLPAYDTIKSDRFVFPFARKGLAKRLTYSIRTNQSPEGYGDLFSRPEHEILAELKEIFSKDAHKVIRRAIKELQRDIGRKAEIITVDSGAFFSRKDKEQVLFDYANGKNPYNPDNDPGMYGPKRWM